MIIGSKFLVFDMYIVAASLKCVCVCACVCVRTCVVCACVCVHVCARTHVYLCFMYICVIVELLHYLIVLSIVSNPL